MNLATTIGKLFKSIGEVADVASTTIGVGSTMVNEWESSFSSEDRVANRTYSRQASLIEERAEIAKRINDLKFEPKSWESAKTKMAALLDNSVKTK